LTIDVGAPTMDDLLDANLGVVDQAKKMGDNML
jgi:hypothetical protein